MKKPIIIFMTVTMLIFSSAAFGADVKQVQEAIKAAGAHWTAGETSVSKLPESEFRALLNWDMEIPENYEPPEEIIVPENLPTHLDWRDIDGDDFTTSIKQQHPCGTCATFSSVGAFEALIKIALSNPFIEPNLSEQHVYACEGPLPYTFFHPMIYLKGSGAPDEACMPYNCEFTGDRPSCDETCTDWSNRTFKTTSYQMMMFPQPAQMMAALQNGPIISGFQVYEDFQDYMGGIYTHVTGHILGGHGVAVVGYDSTERYWICKNSWDTDWGEDGWFRISWDNGLLMGFGYQSFAIQVDTDMLCGADLPPVISDLSIVNASSAPAEDEDLEITFRFTDTEANMAGAELWYSVDGGAEVRYGSPTSELTGTTSDGYDAVVYNLPGPFGGGDHEITVYLKDLCGLSSNEVTQSFSVLGGDDSGDDTAASDDTDAPDSDSSDDDDDDGCGC